MIVWVLWEDQRDARARDFGPHTLLLACIADDLGYPFGKFPQAERVRASPKKGCNKLLAELKLNLKRLLDDGQLCAVFDRDQAHRLWGSDKQVARCRSSLLAKIKNEAPGAYDVVFLEQNVETLYVACCNALGLASGTSKPDPVTRDEVLSKVAFRQPELRAKVRADVPSFDRLVRKVGELVAKL